MAVSVEQLNLFLAQPAPRAIPKGIRRQFVGSWPRAYGLFLFFLAGVLFLAFGKALRRKQVRFNWSTRAVTRGQVMHVARTRDWRFKGKARPRYRIRFRFSPKGMDAIEPTCYRIGDPLRPGESVEVEYVPDDPTLSTIRGCQIDPDYNRPELWLLHAPLFLWLAGDLWYKRAKWILFLQTAPSAPAEIKDLSALGKGKRVFAIGKGARTHALILFCYVGQKRLVARFQLTREQANILQKTKDAGRKVGLLHDPARPDCRPGNAVVLLTDRTLRGAAGPPQYPNAPHLSVDVRMPAAGWCFAGMAVLLLGGGIAFLPEGGACGALLFAFLFGMAALWIRLRAHVNRRDIHILCYNGWREDVEALLERDPQTANACRGRKQKWQPIHMAAAKGHADVIRVLLEHGADANAQDGVGCTALHLAASRGDDSVVELLLDFGADPGRQDEDGYAPLDLAVRYEHESCVRLLQDA